MFSGMDLLVPKPDQLVAAAGNVAQRLWYGGLADLRPMPSTPLDEGARHRVHRYRPAGQAPAVGDPVLLVSPLSAPPTCFDLRRGCSLAEHLVATGRPTYLVEHGEVSFSERGLDLAPWVLEALPAAVRAVSADAGDRPVHLVGWSLGGLLALLTAAAGTDLPIASLSLLGAPVDLSAVPLVAPTRPLLDLGHGTGLLPRAYRALGDAPLPLVRWALELGTVQRLVAKPLAVASHLEDRDYLAQLEAVDRFRAGVTAYPGRTYGQLYHRFLTGNALAGGALELGERTVRLAAVTAPVLVVAGAGDGIAPVAAVRPLVPLLSGARDVRLEIVPGGHLGLLTGRGARTGTWPVLDEWLAQWPEAAAVPPNRQRSGRRRP